ncbi:MAG: hypothetical protein M3N18_07865 [Actinomycetota bacterium]|nr:hypothetical protein [Actinomycetota bacterium]
MPTLAAVRDLFAKHPEYLHHEPWELQWLLFSLRYSDELEDEAEISAAAEVARQDWPPWRAA